jgi:histone acetyltransferase 1
VRKTRIYHRKCPLIHPQGYYRDEAEFLARVEEDATTFKPTGQLIYSYTRPSPVQNGKGKGTANNRILDPESEDTVVYEAYHVNVIIFFPPERYSFQCKMTWNTPGFREYHRRMQLFILLYIEAGSYINEDEDIWEFVVL